MFFLRERGYRIRAGEISAWWSALSQWLHETWERLTGRIRSTRRGLQVHLGTSPFTPALPKAALPAKPRFLRLGNLTPREQIRYYYLSLVRRAGERGIARRTGETPLEYAQNLEQAWPDSEADLDELTRAFLEARYSPHTIAGEDVLTVRERWKRLKSRIRSR